MDPLGCVFVSAWTSDIYIYIYTHLIVFLFPNFVIYSPVIYGLYVWTGVWKLCANSRKVLFTPLGLTRRLSRAWLRVRAWHIQPNGSILYKRRFNTTCYYKGIYLYNMFQRKYTPRTSTKYKQLPSTQESYTYYSTWGREKREWWVISLLSEWIIHIHRIGLIWNQIIRYPQSHSFNTKKII